MENRNVTTFIRIVEFNSFTKAAESLGYSQAAVTAHIKALEKELGVPLFDRIGKQIYLTQEGRTFLPYARNLLKAEEEAVNSVRAAESVSGELTICSSSSYAMGVIPGILLTFMENYPNVKIVVKVSDYPEDTVTKVARGEIDFLACLDESEISGDFITFAKRKERLVFVTYPGNPVLKEKPAAIEDVIRSNLIVSDLDIGYCASLNRELRRRNIELKPVMDMSSVGAIVDILLGGYGISFLPEFVVSEYIEKGELVVMDVEDIDIDLYSYFVCSSERWINPAMKEFMKHVEQCLAQSRLPALSPEDPAEQDFRSNKKPGVQ